MRRLVNVCILDEDPIHLGAFETIASGDESILMKVFDSVEDARQWTSNPELLLVNLSHDLICSNRLLLQILNAFKTATVMCYSSSKWIGMRALRTHNERLVVLTYGEVANSLRRYVAPGQGNKSAQELFPEKRLAVLDHELEHTLECLSPKEREVFCLLGKGYGNPEIADMLGRKQNTVESHLKSIRYKLQFKGVMELRTLSARFAQTGICHVFSRFDSHICRHSGKSVGYCPLYDCE
jgi:DNA-binding NarL/FixJ family response regulator